MLKGKEDAQSSIACDNHRLARLLSSWPILALSAARLNLFDYGSVYSLLVSRQTLNL